MGLPSRFDAIVVGAGPAGCSAAYRLAEKGFKVLLVERGRVPGSKNVYGGRVYADPLRKIFPDFDKSAPIERWVVGERMSLVRGDDAVTIDYRYGEPVSFIAYLSKLCEWMASKAEEAGAILVTEVTVDELLMKDGRVAGIRAGNDIVEADVVVDAEGVNRLLLERAGLVEKLRPSTLALGVKEVIKVPAKKLEERLGLGDGEGMAWLVAGDITGGLPGGAFLYTNKDSISLGMILFLDKAVEKLREPVYTLVEKLRLHKLFRSLLGDGTLMEYSAHLTPHDPFALMPRRLYHDGLVIVGDAAGFLVDMAYTVRGVDLAAYSGYLAARAIEQAHSQGSMSAENLAVYERMIRESFVYKELVKFREVRELLRSPKLLEEYPRLALSILGGMYRFGFEAPKLVDLVKKECGGTIGMLKLLLELYGVVKKL